jgi:hypothetical protein
MARTIQGDRLGSYRHTELRTTADPPIISTSRRQAEGRQKRCKAARACSAARPVRCRVRWAGLCKPARAAPPPCCQSPAALVMAERPPHRPRQLSCWSGDGKAEPGPGPGLWPAAPSTSARVVSSAVAAACSVAASRVRVAARAAYTAPTSRVSARCWSRVIAARSSVWCAAAAEPRQAGRPERLVGPLGGRRLQIRPHYIQECGRPTSIGSCGLWRIRQCSASAVDTDRGGWP